MNLAEKKSITLTPLEIERIAVASARGALKEAMGNLVVAPVRDAIAEKIGLGIALAVAYKIEQRDRETGQ